MPKHHSSLPKQTSLSIHFIIVGGGLAGLACAIALKRVGHRVTVLEKTQSLPTSSGGTRMPPNLSKILFSWGYEQELRTITLKSGGLNLYLQNTGESLGSHAWDEEVLKETGGEFLFTHHCDLYRFLYEKAIFLGANVRMNTTAISIDPVFRAILLSTGESLRGDVIIGADGLLGISRAVVLTSQDVDIRGATLGLSIPDMDMYSLVIPISPLKDDNSLVAFLDDHQTTLQTWFGNSRGILAFPVGGAPEFAIYAYAPSVGDRKTWNDPIAVNDVKTVFGSCESRLEKLGSLASFAVCVPVEDTPELEDWVDGRLVVVGNAAHPLPPGSIQECALAIEDAAVLGKLFSHLHSEDQIDSFLWAFQDLRKGRCAFITRKEREIIQFLTAESGSLLQEERDKAMRAKRDAGVYALHSLGDEIEETQEWLDIKEVFAYDAEDEADNWWVEWGLLRERARHVSLDASSFHGATMNIKIEYTSVY
ncbi:hypothetical protein Moror_14964 [Moniliophthora roreri MCA 2997]|uniref:FAD-binding domain-containing protein n=1 Tax=Moniliophthora roreri (strain MCA 2997) TaxID=1381753 RepID=V2XZL3_MONRO|nr:hypothetical protein Moror_14964 [Moniliophthora roreri MCA 2997]